MTTRLERITQQRQQKLERIRDRGINPYPNIYHRSHSTQEAVALLKQNEEGLTKEKEVSVAGRIMAKRPMGKSAFIDIRDSSGKIQLLFQNLHKFDEEDSELFKDLDIGDIVGAEGTLLRTKSGEPTVLVGDFTMLAKSLQPLPEKWHGISDIDIRYRQRYLDLIANTEVKKTFQVRSQVMGECVCGICRDANIQEHRVVLPADGGWRLKRPL